MLGQGLLSLDLRPHPHGKPRDLRTAYAELPLGGRDLVGLIDAVLKRGSSVALKATGCSMYPFIRDGDVLHLSPTAADSICLGDVVAFRKSVGEGMMVHRVAGKVGSRYLLRGDGCAEPDGLIPETDILGR